MIERYFGIILKHKILTILVFGSLYLFFKDDIHELFLPQFVTIELVGPFENKIIKIPMNLVQSRFKALYAEGTPENPHKRERAHILLNYPEFEQSGKERSRSGSSYGWTRVSWSIALPVFIKNQEGTFLNCKADRCGENSNRTIRKSKYGWYVWEHGLESGKIKLYRRRSDAHPAAFSANCSSRPDKCMIQIQTKKGFLITAHFPQSDFDNWDQNADRLAAAIDSFLIKNLEHESYIENLMPEKD